MRGLGLGSATALNMIDMIGVGPFITIPLIVTVMGGPQALLGWVAGAILAICDGLVWAELGAAMPGSGGSYRYLKEIYGPEKLGRLVSFLFIWQLSFSAPLSIASGAVGLSQYAAFFFPRLENIWSTRTWSLHLPLAGRCNSRGSPCRQPSWPSESARSPLSCSTAASPPSRASDRALGRSHGHNRMDHLCRPHTLEVGVISPEPVPSDSLGAGEVGYLITGVKDVRRARVGDTVTSAARPATEALPGYDHHGRWCSPACTRWTATTTPNCATPSTS